MNTVTVYRVEKPDGTGPYFSRYGGYHWGDRLERMRSDHSDEAHPSPGQDPMLETIEIYEKSCFKSLEQLTEWFKGWAVQLAEEGYAVTEYTVEPGHVRYGEHQAVYYAKKAIYVRSLSLLDPRHTEGTECINPSTPKGNAYGSLPMHPRMTVRRER